MTPIDRTTFEELKQRVREQGLLNDNLREYLSPSSLSLYQDCGEAWRVRYVKGEPYGPPNDKMVLGSYVHCLVEQYLKNVISAYKSKGLHASEVTIEQVRDINKALSTDIDVLDLDDHFREERLKILGTFPDQEGGSPPWEAAKKNAQEIFNTWHKDMVQQSYVPETAEETYYLRVGEIPVLCRVDMVLWDPLTNIRMAVDLKVGAMARDANDSLQLAICGVATSAAHVAFWQLKPPKIRVGARSIPPAPLEITTKHKSFMSKIIEQTALGIRSNFFPYANPTHWKCSSKFCDNYTKCRG